MEEQIEKIKLKFKDSKSKPGYIIVTNFQKFLVSDTKTFENLKFDFEKLPQYFDFFLGWKGIEKVDYERENPADLKAAERFAKIYNVLLKDNPNISRHTYNLFLIRLLFCLFAEDTGIFEENLFTNYIKRFSNEDASDLNLRIKELFEILDIKEEKQDNDISTTLRKFPYVNGQLFTEKHTDIVFKKKSRDLIIDAGELLDWDKINPDILGSMLQAVSNEDHRSHLGMHYTSVPNIMKVIKPLFLDDLEEEFNNSKGSIEKLNNLLTRIGNIKFMDLACGSGNFLVIAYKELRKFEMEILNEQRKLNPSTFYIPTVKLSQFYGMEIDDFATDVARLSLWIADHQMNKVLQNKYNDVLRPTLPLQQVGKIKCTNALREDWEKFLPHNDNDEIYIFGNPPYLGARKQSKEQKEDLGLSFTSKIKEINNLDYVSGWFLKGISYIQGTEAKYAYLTTNSINQGEQVDILWPNILKNNGTIFFAYKSLKWKNNAKNNATVTVNIIGIADKDHFNKDKKLYKDSRMKIVKNINPYLLEGPNILVKKEKEQLFGLPKITTGSMPNVNVLLLNLNEYENLPKEAKKFFRKAIGAQEFNKGIERYCLWLYDIDKSEYQNIPEILEIIKKVKKYRESRDRKQTIKFAQTPELFGEIRWQNADAIIVPSHTKNTRYYIPMGLVEKGNIILHSATAIYNAPVWLLGLLQSKMHNIWIELVCGRLGNQYRYSAEVVYNTFPVPQLSTQKKNIIEELTWKILDIREEEEENIDKLYGYPLDSKNPKPMNERLKKAHEELDEVVEKAYRTSPFKDDDERLSFLLKMYEEKRNEEK